MGLESRFCLLAVLLSLVALGVHGNLYAKSTGLGCFDFTVTPTTGTVVNSTVLTINITFSESVQIR